MDYAAKSLGSLTYAVRCVQYGSQAARDQTRVGGSPNRKGGWSGSGDGRRIVDARSRPSRLDAQGDLSYRLGYSYIILDISGSYARKEDSRGVGESGFVKSPTPASLMDTRQL